MNEYCGCCEGIEKLTPVVIANRPGLPALSYRAGTHASFLETMLARLSNFPLEILLDEFDASGKQKKETLYPLSGLTTRSTNDPAIAMLDAWATVADVLTFYQERIANEGYLRTATERRSILELARLVGYILRPGIAASVFLAYTLEKDHDVIILPGNRAQSVPGSGELPQTFETAEKLEARYAWNALKPRLTRPQYIVGEVLTNENKMKINTDRIYLQGIATKLKPGDPLLLVFGNNQFAFLTVSDIEAQAAESRTKVSLQSTSSTETTTLLRPMLMALATKEPPISLFRELVTPLSTALLPQPRNTQRLERNVPQAFAPLSDIHPQLLLNFNPLLQSTLYSALTNVQITQIQKQQLQLENVQTLRVKAAPFGHNAPLKPIFYPDRPGVAVGYEEWPLNGTISIEVTPSLHGNTAQLSIKRVTETATITIELKDQIITLNQLNIKVTLKKSGELAAASIDEVLFEFPDLKGEAIRLQAEGTTWSSVQVEPDSKRLASQGQKQWYSTEQHKVQLEFRGTEVYVSDELPLPAQYEQTLPLDAQYDKLLPKSLVVIERAQPDGKPSTYQVRTVESVQTVSMAAYGITGRVTQLTLDGTWLEDGDRLLSAVRNITVYAQSEQLGLADEPIDEDIPEKIKDNTDQTAQVRTDTIELDGLYDGLKSGQRLIVSGERTDVTLNGAVVPGVRGTEPVILKSARQDVHKLSDGTDLPKDKKHTYLQLANKLAYTYKRDTVTIYANVVRATHGETRTEVLGSGDGSKGLQQFTLRQSPLTYISSPTPAGAESTLGVRINDILWHEAEDLNGQKPTDHGYIAHTDDAGNTTIIFGNGTYGARLPTGVENVKAVYRTGIGKPGNVKEEQISLLTTKPLGVKAVINPLRASGGADKENIIQARRNVPSALLALDRLVSVQDYQDFARTYAGIGKSSAVRLSDKRRQLIHLTIAGADNIPIDTTSDLYLNLFQSLRKFGDPNEPLRIDLADVLFLVISAKVRLLPDYQLESVEPKIRTKLLDTFSFDRRELGQSVFQSEVFSVI